MDIITLKIILWHHPTKITLEKPQDSHKNNTSLQQKGGETYSGCIKNRHPRANLQEGRQFRNFMG